MSDSDFLKRRGLRMARTWLLNSGVAMALGLACAICAAAAEPAAVDPVAKRLGPVMSELRCPIMAHLAAVRNVPVKPDGHNRYLIVSLERAINFYAQCIFYKEDGDHILCEAASGFYYEGTLKFLTPEKIAIIAALGYSTDRSEGNFKWEHSDDGLETLYDVAGLIVETLVRVFDLGVGEKVKFEAPLVPKHHLTGVEGSKHCPIPIS